MDLKTNKYKDRLPNETIAGIQESLKCMGLVAKEYYFKHSVKDFYSLSVAIEGTSISVNGKGTTKAYARASAYAELMERLQNQSFFRLNGELRQSIVEKEGFYYAPDEVYRSTKALLKEPNEWLKGQLVGVDKQRVGKYLKEWQGIYSYQTPADFVCLPYMNVMTNNISYIPINMVSKMYMSNGMCAGNTRAEALVQGLSEILERVVNTRIIQEGLTPPDIPDSYLKAYPNVYEMVQQIRAFDGAKLIVKDCSLGKGYPVVGIILINQYTKSYFVKFGSHPCFEIALERCLTELLQGQDIQCMKGMQPFKLYPQEHDAHANMMGILVNGIGSYPYKLFMKKPSYAFRGYVANEDKDNEALLKWMLDLLAKEKKEVYVRDVSFTGFKSYSVIVAHMSEIEKFTDYKAVSDYSEYVYVKQLIKKVGHLNGYETENVLDYCDRQGLTGYMDIMKFIGGTEEDVGLRHYTHIDLLKALIAYKARQYSRAYSYMNAYVTDLEQGYDREICMQYRCVRDYIGTKAEGLKEESTMEILENFYERSMVQGVEKWFCNPDRVFEYYGTVVDEYKGETPFEKVYLAVKKTYREQNVEQGILAGMYR